MPPPSDVYEAFIVGSVHVQASSVPATHGLGGLSLDSDIIFTKDRESFISASVGDLTVSAKRGMKLLADGTALVTAATGLGISTLAGDAVMTSTTGDCRVNALAGAVQVLAKTTVRVASDGDGTVESTSNAVTVRSKLAARLESMDASVLVVGKGNVEVRTTGAGTAASLASASGPALVQGGTTVTLAASAGVACVTSNTSVSLQAPTLDVSTAATVVLARADGNVSVPGTLTVNNLTVTGDSATINAANFAARDPLLLINSAPSVSAPHVGIVTRRFQEDIRHDAPACTGTLAAAGSTTLSLRLVSSAALSLVNGFYDGWLVCVGAESSLVKTHTAGATPALELVSALPASLPLGGQAFQLFDKTGTAVVWCESDSCFRLAYTYHDGATKNSIKVVREADLRVSNLSVAETIHERNGGSLVVTLAPHDTVSTVVLAGLELHGAYQLLVSSVDDGGATMSMYIAKASKLSSTLSSMGVSVPGTSDRGELLEVVWETNKPPALKFNRPSINPALTGLVYRVRYLGA